MILTNSWPTLVSEKLVFDKSETIACPKTSSRSNKKKAFDNFNQSDTIIRSFFTNQRSRWWNTWLKNRPLQPFLLIQQQGGNGPKKIIQRQVCLFWRQILCVFPYTLLLMMFDTSSCLYKRKDRKVEWSSCLEKYLASMFCPVILSMIGRRLQFLDRMVLPSWYNVVSTFIWRYMNVMAVRWTLKQCYVPAVCSFPYEWCGNENYTLKVLNLHYYQWNQSAKGYP